MDKKEKEPKNCTQEDLEIEDFIILGIVINDKGKVLVIRRVKEDVGSDGSVLTWSFPGGKQWLNENRRECVEKEILAETGYAVHSIREISLRHHPHFPVIIVYHLCKLTSLKPVAEPSEPHEIAEIRWVKPQEIKTLFTTDFDPKVSRELGLK